MNRKRESIGCYHHDVQYFSLSLSLLSFAFRSETRGDIEKENKREISRFVEFDRLTCLFSRHFSIRDYRTHDKNRMETKHLITVGLLVTENQISIDNSNLIEWFDRFGSVGTGRYDIQRILFGFISSLCCS